ncbi:MAG TPA: translation initiation factor IF-3 [Actinomycetota bacterium]|nr:translation initiation factor IF-3 [Actinomycetota bacterium]
MAPEPRLNDRIRVPEVRVVGPGGEQMGIMPIAQALNRAQALDLDLVEVAPQADPPVCKIMDYGKYKYEQDVKAKEARKRQQQVTVKEMKFKPKISTHDYDTKKHHIERFLNQGSKVKITVWFRGREMQHTELGARLLTNLSKELEEVATVEMHPKLDGKNMVMVLAPVKKTGTKSEKEPKNQPA